MKQFIPTLALFFLFCVFSDALTLERDIIALKLFKREVENRDEFWKGIVATWSGGGPNGEDDPCGNGWKSTWDGVECRFQGDIPDDIPKVVTNLHVTDSEVTGPIPLAISLLEDLVEIDFDGNRISGPLNPYVGCLSNLRELDLANNSLSGTIPTEWRFMRQLEEVELETNARLSGCIPRGMPPLKTVCREKTPQEIVLNPGRPRCELIGTIVYDTAVGGFCPDLPRLDKRCPDVPFVEEFIRNGMPYELYYQSQASSATVTPIDRVVPVENENGLVRSVYGEVDPVTKRVRIRNVVRSDQEVLKDIMPNRRSSRERSTSRRSRESSSRSTRVSNGRFGVLGLVNSLFAR